MNTLKRLRKTLRKKKNLWRELWRDITEVVRVAVPAKPAAPPPPKAPTQPAVKAEPVDLPVPPMKLPAPSARKKVSTRRRRTATVPAVVAGALENQPAPSKPLPPGKRVLMIDDDVTYLQLTARLLKPYAVEVEIAEGVDNGVMAARRKRPDVLLVDYNMPGVTGFELIQRLRSDEDLAAVPRIVVTGYGRVEDLREALRWDVVEVLTKPVSRQGLVESLEKAMGGKLPMRPAESERKTEQKPVAAAGQVELNQPRPFDAKPAGAVTVPKLPAVEPPPIPEPANLSKLIDLKDMPQADDLEIKSPAQNAAEELTNVDAAPTVKAVATIFKEAIERKASDIHIEPLQKGLQVRFRLDGELVEMMTLPLGVAPGVAARIKVLASLDIAERRLPQDGRICVQLKGRRVDLRVSTLPSLYGEKIVLRIIGMAKIDGDLGKFGLPPAELDLLKWSLGQPNGLILMTGPTGSGKSTSLYRMLGYLNNGKRNIVTVEDPIEGELDGVTQVAVNADIGLTFQKALRAFLRQDPDVMLVGEIRDSETADIATRAALTGRLILSTLHTNDAVVTVSRLNNMGVPGYMLAASLRLVVAQRLVRLLCVHCRKEDVPTPAEVQVLAAGGGASISKLYRSAGCPHCAGLGFSGRAPVMEIMAVKTNAMRELIRQQAPLEPMRVQAIADGMRPLARAALDLVADGRTTLGEALRAASFD